MISGPKELTKGTQLYKIVQKLKKKSGTTCRELIMTCGTNYPNRRMTDLKELGYEICDEWVTKRDKDGKVTDRFKVYRLCG